MIDSTTPIPQAKRQTLQTMEGRNKEKIITYAFLAMSLVTISFFGIFAILPAFSTISNLRKQYEDNKNVASLLETKLNALSSLDREFQTLQNDLPYVYNAIPSSAQISTFTRQVETLAKNTNVQLESFSTGSVEYFPLEEGVSDLYAFTFSLQASGSEANMNQFINELISFNRLVSIDRITSGSSGSEAKTSIGGKVFFSKDN